MILDAQLLFSDAQAVTAAAGSTNTVDLGSVRDIGTGEPLYIVVTTDVAMTDAGSDSALVVALEGDSTAVFTPDGTQDLFTSPAVSPAGSIFIARLNPGMPPLQYRYARLKYTPSNGDLTTGSFTACIVHDIQKFVAYAKNYTIS
jgi:hypothetical protein